MKKAISILLTAAMLISTTITVFADELTVYGKFPVKLNGEDSGYTALNLGDANLLGGGYVPLSSIAAEFGYSVTVDEANRSFTIISPYKTMTYKADNGSVECAGLSFNSTNGDIWNLEYNGIDVSNTNYPVISTYYNLRDSQNSQIRFSDGEAYISNDMLSNILDLYALEGATADTFESADFGYNLYIDGENANWNLATIIDVDYANRTVTLDDMIKGNVTAKLDTWALLDFPNLSYVENFDFTNSGHMRTESHRFHQNVEYSIYDLNKGDEVRVVYDSNNNIKQLYKNDYPYFNRIHGTVENAGWIYDEDFVEVEILPEPKLDEDSEWIEDAIYDESSYLNGDPYFVLKLNDGRCMAISAMSEYAETAESIVMNRSKERITDLSYLKGKEVDIAASVVAEEPSAMWNGMIEGLIVVINEDSSPASVTAPVPAKASSAPTTVSTVPNKTSASDEVSVTLNGNGIIFDQPPVIIDGRTLVPMRAIFEAMGCNVEWDGQTKTIEAFNSDGDKVIEMQVGSENMWSADNPSITLDVPPQIINDRTLVPVRAISESMGAEVNWHGDTRNVEIIYN